MSISTLHKFKPGDPVRIVAMALRSGPCVVPGVLAGKVGIFKGYWDPEENGTLYSHIEIEGEIKCIMTKRLRLVWEGELSKCLD